jgi:hypothetical protein
MNSRPVGARGGTPPSHCGGHRSASAGLAYKGAIPSAYTQMLRDGSAVHIRRERPGPREPLRIGNERRRCKDRRLVVQFVTARNLKEISVAAMGKRLAYTLLGFSIGLVVALALGSVVGERFAACGVGIALGCGSLAVAIAEWRGKVKSVEEINRPITLFPRTSSAPTDAEKPK